MKNFRLISILVLAAFCLNTVCPVSPAQAVVNARSLPAGRQVRSLPSPGVMVALSAPMNPPILKGIKVHPDNPFRFDFILDKGDTNTVGARFPGPNIQGGETPPLPLRDEATRLIKYFLASLTVPEKDLWVNLSPYEKDQIVPESFGQTEMGRDLLAQDYLLKQITASLIYPEDELGKKFWKRIYAEAIKKYGSADIPVNTFNKVWIVPEKAVVYENAKAGTAYVVESSLKVMLEEDYLAKDKHSSQAGSSDDKTQIGSQIIREIVLPELVLEINTGANFAQLRQVYNSLILATWYKKKIKDSILSKVYADQNKVAGVGHTDSLIPETIYNQYLQAFKKGVYNYIKEETDPTTSQSIPRKYFSGGMELAFSVQGNEKLTIEQVNQGNAAMVSKIRSLVTDASLLVSMTLSTQRDSAMQTSGGFSEEDLANIQSRGWFKNFSDSQRQEVFRSLAVRFYHLNKSHHPFFSYWAKILGISMMDWLKEGLINFEVLQENLFRFELTHADGNHDCEMEIMALHLAMGLKIWTGLKDHSSPEARQVVSSVQKSLVTGHLKTLRGAYDILSNYFGKEWIPFLKVCANDAWPSESLELWQLERGYIDPKDRFINTNMPVYVSLPYFDDGRGDAVLAWNLLLGLRKKYSQNPINLVVENKDVLTRWLRIIDPEIRPNMADQIVKGIRIVISDESLEKYWATQQGYVLIKLAPSKWSPGPIYNGRVFAISDFDDLESNVFLDDDFLGFGFMPGTLGIHESLSNDVQPVVTPIERQQLLQTLGINGVNAASFSAWRWGVAYAHTSKGLEEYVENLVGVSRNEPIVLFDIGGKNRKHWHFGEKGKPYKVPNVQVIDLSAEKEKLDLKAKVIIVQILGNVPERLYQQILLSSDFAPQIRGSATASYLFGRGRAFLIERMPLIMKNSFKYLQARARALGPELWSNQRAFDFPELYFQHNQSVLQAIYQSQPWNIVERLSVYTDYLLSGHNMPRKKTAIQFAALYSLINIKKKIATKIFQRRLYNIAQAYPEELKALLQEVRSRNPSYMDIIPSEFVDHIIYRLEELGRNFLKETNIGGIDLTSDQALLVQNAGESIEFHMDSTMLTQLQNVSGFTPIIINIQPFNNLPEFLGLP